MASGKVLVADFGIRSLSLGAFRTLAGGGLELSTLIQRQFAWEGGVNEFSYEPLKALLILWRKQENLKKGESLSISLPSQLLLTRFLKLPGEHSEEVEAMMQFEAQNIPFPKHEMIWGYQILEPPLQTTWNVILIATKKAPFLAFRKAIADAGFLMGRVDAAPIAIYNAFRFSYADANQCSLILNLNPSSTDLIFCEQEKLFIRSIQLPNGRDSLPPSHSTPEQSTEPPVLHKNSIPSHRTLVTNQIRREIEHSISFYCNHQGGSLPTQAFICGTAEPIDLQKHLREEMRLETQVFNPFRNLQMPAQFTRNVPIYSLGPIVGLATHALKNVPVDINLMGLEVAKETASTRKRIWILAAMVCLILAVAETWLYFARAARLKTNARESGEMQFTSLKVQAKQLKELRDRNEQLKNHLLPFLDAIAERALWPSLIHLLEKSLPPKFIWITRLEALADNQPILLPPSERNKKRASSRKTNRQLLIEGLYLENPLQAKVIDQFVQNLAASSLFTITDPSKLIRLRDTPDGEHWAYRYRMVLPLK